MTYALRLCFLVAALVTLASCTPTTGTKVTLNQAEISKIKSVGVLVKTEEEFSVRLSREEMSNAGASMFGLIGVGVEAAIRRSSDKNVEEQLKASVGNYDPEKSLAERLRYHLQISGSIGAASKPENIGDVSKQTDAVLEVTIREWGMRRCPGPATEVVQAAFNVNGKLYRTGDRDVVWERDELYLNGDCRPWAAFKSEDLSKEILPRAVDTLASKLVYEILFP